ncbi:MAG: hypothetical protein HY648_08940, partial [Acidobacteria bacterium]|nr:hypothetical protein [Acidobacteriota bacterium]
MSITPSLTPHDPSGKQGTPNSASPATTTLSRLPIIVLAAALVAGFGGIFYYASQLSSRLDQLKSGFETGLKTSSESQGAELQKLARRLDQTEARTAELEGQFTVTRERLGMTQGELRRAQQIAAQLAQQQKDAEAQLASQIGQLQQEQVATKGSVGSLSTDVTGVRAEVKSTKEDLEATRSELKRVVGDLGVQSDLVAHNRAELEDLRRLGTRDYVEFDLRKNKRAQRVGLIQLELKNT